MSVSREGVQLCEGRSAVSCLVCCCRSGCVSQSGQCCKLRCCFTVLIWRHELHLNSALGPLPEVVTSHVPTQLSGCALANQMGRRDGGVHCSDAVLL
jgi:hypothetical protein